MVNKVYNAVTLPVEAQLSENLRADYELDSPSPEPDSIKIGIKEGAAAPERLTVTVSAIESGEKEFDIDSAEGIYIPEDSMRVKVNVNAHEKTTGNNEEQ